MVKELKNEQELDELISSSEYLVVKFSATWCGPCNYMKEAIDSWKDEEDFKNVIIVSIDIDEFKDLSEKYQIRCVPTFLFYREGKLVNKMFGQIDRDSFKACIYE